MSHLRSEFEQETGKVSGNCTGLGDYSGIQADADIDSDYIKWLEAKVEKLNSAEWLERVAFVREMEINRLKKEEAQNSTDNSESPKLPGSCISCSEFERCHKSIEYKSDDCNAMLRRKV